MGKGRVARLVLERRDGAPIALACWVPEALNKEQLTDAVVSSLADQDWQTLLFTLDHAREFPPDEQRAPLSRELREFRYELLGPQTPDSVSPELSPDVQLIEGCGDEEMMVTSSTPGTASTGQQEPAFSACACYYWEAKITFSNDSWVITVSFSYCSGSSGNDYEGMIGGGYWQWPCGGPVPSARDTIRFEYTDTTLFRGQPWMPDCNDIRSSVNSPTGMYAWRSISGNLQHGVSPYRLGVFQSVMLTGVEWMSDNWGSTLAVNSFYRCPHHNQAIGSTARTSRHMYGDAADFGNPNAGAAPAVADSTWDQMFLTAQSVPYAMPLTRIQDPSCSRACLHVDWRALFADQ